MSREANKTALLALVCKHESASCIIYLITHNAELPVFEVRLFIMSTMSLLRVKWTVRCELLSVNYHQVPLDQESTSLCPVEGHRLSKNRGLEKSSYRSWGTSTKYAYESTQPLTVPLTEHTLTTITSGMTQDVLFFCRRTTMITVTQPLTVHSCSTSIVGFLKLGLESWSPGKRALHAPRYL